MKQIDAVVHDTPKSKSRASIASQAAVASVYGGTQGGAMALLASILSTRGSPE